jgi:hypothetical protein
VLTGSASKLPPIHNTERISGASFVMERIRAAPRVVGIKTLKGFTG